MNSKQLHNARRGFTLTEAAIVLGIMGLILGAIWVAAAAVYQNIRISRSSQQLLQLVQSVRSMYASSNTVDGDATGPDYVHAGVYPTDLVEQKNATSVADSSQNMWGGDVDVVADPCGAAGLTDQCFKVTFTKVPANACADFIMRNSGQGSETGLYGVGVTDIEYTFPLKFSDVVTDCGTGESSVNFIFKLQN